MKILVAGGGSGKGIAVNNKTKATTYMKMAEIQAGLGFGAKKFQVVWVFETDAALNNFVNSGWEFGGQATAAAKADDKGAAYQGAVAVVAGGLDLPGHRQRPGARAHRQGDQVLQGQRPELRPAPQCEGCRLTAGGLRGQSLRALSESHDGRSIASIVAGAAASLSAPYGPESLTIRSALSISTREVCDGSPV